MYYITSIFCSFTVSAQIQSLQNTNSNQYLISFFSESMRDLKKLQSHHSFKEFMQAHNKDYPNFDEYQKRFGIFKENMQKVQFLSETERGTGKGLINLLSKVHFPLQFYN